MADFLALEPLLVARLREQLQGQFSPPVTVLPVADLAGILESNLPVPAVCVLYRNYTPGDKSQPGRVNVTQRWATVVAVNNARDAVSGEAARAEAGPIMGAVIAAINGWQPADDFKFMQFDAVFPTYFRAGFGYFPLGWSVEYRFRFQPAA